MLRQRLDRNERLERLSEQPILGERVGMQARPLADESHRTGRKRPAENSQRS
jgi:hypothetical protein